MSHPIEQFVEAASQPARVLEIGTLQSVPGVSTHHSSWFPGSAYTMADIAAGPDVDQVVDVHRLPAEWGDYFDAFVAVAVWEHLERPWIAAREVARTLAPGGVCYIEAHQTFPLHGYPQDFFRFSKDALALIFADVGLEVIAADYLYPCKITPLVEINGWNDEGCPSFLNVYFIGRKPHLWAAG